MPNVTLNRIDERLTNLIRSVDEGFKGVHERQDKTNGNVKENTEWRYANTTTLKNMQKVVYGGVGLILASVIMAIISLVIKT